MPNLYLELKNKHQEEVNNFPMAFAFSNKQFEEGMKKLGLEPHQTEQVVSIGLGGFVRKTDADAFVNMLTQHENEMKSAMSNDQFIFDMFNYELANHEYTYTYSVGDTLAALGLTMEEVEADERLHAALKEACAYQFEVQEI